MRCRRCGAEMPEGALRCEECGAEIRIVPDYNPLDDVLAAQVKGAIDGSDTPLDDYDYQTSTIPTARRNSGTLEVSLIAGLHPVSVGLRPDNVDLKERTDPEDNLLRRKSAGDVLPGKKL